MATMTCNHVFGKKAGQNEGKRCSVKVSKDGGLCSKHTPVPADQKKLSIKKWEEVMLPQIPYQLVKYYHEEKNYIHRTKLTRRTANNAAAWILVKYYGLPPGSVVDFQRQMREALVWSDVHPINKMNQYFYEPEYMPAAIKRDEKGFAVYMANHKYMTRVV